MPVKGSCMKQKRQNPLAEMTFGPKTTTKGNNYCMEQHLTCVIKEMEAVPGLFLAKPENRQSVKSSL